jgi:hypothetical protein
VVANLGSSPMSNIGLSSDDADARRLIARARVPRLEARRAYILPIE